MPTFKLQQVTSLADSTPIGAAFERTEASLPSVLSGLAPGGWYDSWYLAPQARSQVVSGSAFLTMTEAGRDKLIFDSGAARSANAALVALSGTGTAGQVVQGRAVSQGDAGATSTTWADIATISGGGTWSGAIAVPRSSRWQKAETRLKAVPATTAIAANVFGSGHVLAIWGQSEDARIAMPVFSLTTPVAISDAEAVQVAYFTNATTFTRALAPVTTAAPITAGIAAMAATLIAARPGDKFAVAFQTVSGTSYGELVNDAVLPRQWVNDLALHNLLTDNGKTPVGLAMSTWTASTSGYGDNFIEALFPMFTGRRQDGTAFAVPGVHTYTGGGSMTLDHTFAEIYDYTKTRWTLFGPHVFTPDNDMTNAVTNRSGNTPNPDLANKQKIRAQIRAFPAQARATVDGSVGGVPIFIGGGLDLITYESGVSEVASPFWSDWGHPSGASADGLELRARYLALEGLRAMGLTSWQVPKFDTATWQSDGSYVEVGSTAGPITTVRRVRLEAALPTTFPHWTEVFGWQINGAPARRAEIVAGKVRIFPITAPFTSSDVISYGEGGASGIIEVAEDYVARTWKNSPIVVQASAPGVPGIPVWPMPATTALENTIGGVPYFTSVTPGVYFDDPLDFAKSTDPQSQITIEARLGVNNISTTPVIAAFSGSTLTLDVTPTGTLRVSLRDSAGLVVLSSVGSASGALPNGVVATVVLSVNLTAGYVRLWVNGTQVLSRDAVSATPLPANSGFLGNGRQLTLLAKTGGTSRAFGRVEGFKVWKIATPNGVTSGLGTPYKALAGNAAAVVATTQFTVVNPSGAV